MLDRLPDLHLPEVRLPRPKIRLDLDLDDPRRLGEPLQFFFCLLLFVALLAIFSGATATGILMLIAGAALHVLRSSLEEVAAQRRLRRERGERKREVRLREHRAARRAREARVAARRRPVVAQPGASPARKQRVI
jgi:hypothetical protein